jgi:hypothetical protein
MNTEKQNRYINGGWESMERYGSRKPKKHNAMVRYIEMYTNKCNTQMYTYIHTYVRTYIHTRIVVLDPMPNVDAMFGHG